MRHHHYEDNRNHLILHDSERQVHDLIINNILERLRALELLVIKKREKKRDLDEIGLVNPNYCGKSSVKRSSQNRKRIKSRS